MNKALAGSLATLLVSAGLLALVPVPAQAVTLLSIAGNGFLEDDAAPQDAFGDSYSQQAAAGFLDDALSGHIQTQNAATAGTIASRSKASFGLLGAETVLVLFAPLQEFGNRHNGSGNAAASFFDDITITPANPSLQGQPGKLRGVLYLTGSVFVDADNVPVLPPNFLASSIVSGWDASIGLSDGISNSLVPWNGSGRIDNGMLPEYTGTMLPVALNFELPYRLGSTAQLSVSLFVQSVGGALAGRGDVSGSVSLYNTLGWGGITAVTTEDGTPIDFQLTSGSGVDWTQSAVTPIPLPGSAWLLLTGFGGLAARAGWRHGAKRSRQRQSRRA